MKKKLPTFVLFVFLMVVVALVYTTYAVYCNVTIHAMKSQVVMAQRTWVNYVRLVTKVNSKEIKYLTNSNELINLLNAVNQTEIKENDTSSSDLESFAENKISDDIDLIVVYNSSGHVKAAFEKGENTPPEINLPQALQRVLTGEELVLNINLFDHLYYISMAPVIVDSTSIGAVLIGKRINNNAATYIQQLADTDIVVFAKDKLLATSLTTSGTDSLLMMVQGNDPEMMNVFNKSKITSNEDVSYLQTSFGSFWAAGNHLANNTAGYILLVKNSNWVTPYFYVQDNIKYILPLVLLVVGLISVLLMTILNKVNTKVVVSTAVAKEKIETKSWIYSMKFDKKVDSILNALISFFEIDFFNTTKEMNKLAKDAQIMVKTYKARVIVDDFEETKKVDSVVNPMIKKDCTVNSRKSTLYFSNVASFNDIIKNYTPDKAFNLLSIYLKIQQEVIQKHNGRIIKQVDDRIVAAFESSSHAEEAIRTAFNVQNTIYRLSSVNVENFDISIGISSGDVLIASMSDQITYMGYAAQVGDSLCNKTPPGSVYIDKATYDIAGVQYLKADLDSFRVKGINKSVFYYKFDDDSVIQQSSVIQDVDARIKVK